MAPNIPDVRYVACWTDDDGIYSWGHDHRDIPGAMGCMVPGRTFIRARENGVLRSLNEGETAVFLVDLMERSERG